jgi:AraC family transcriptional regulator of adaptative response / methylphosphotriester-DNA alkyltransferase methyltransferase
MRAVQAVSESFRPCKRCKPDGLKLPGEEWVDQISRFIDEHYQESLTLSVLADTLHTSPYHMHRTFKRIQGVTPLEYIQQRRISAAQALLSRTGMPVTEVAMNTGFPNAAHFSTVFQKRTGMSPTAYRQTYSDELNSGNGG